MPLISLPFGIEKEAEIYCNSSIIAMKQQPPVQNVINTVSRNMVNQGFDSIPYNEVARIICQWTEENVEQNGWDKYDEDGVSWFKGLTATAYVRCFRNTMKPYEQVFKDCFMHYFS